MISYRQLHEAPVYQLRSWWDNIALGPGKWTHEEAIDEVAFRWEFTQAVKEYDGTPQ